jgi:hypothetical protein
MKKINFFDENLLGQPGLSRYLSPNLDWFREIYDYDIAIYTDKMCFSQKLDNSKINCAWIIEPPIINGENYRDIVISQDNFKYVFTHNKNTLSNLRNGVYVPHGGTWLREEDINVHHKTKNCSFIFSNKDWNSYHRLRHRIAARFENDNRVDFFGSGSKNPVEFKIEALKDYMFSIVVENSIESDYFTEKILDCFLSGTIPIYLGSKTTSNYFDSDGIIYFDGDEDLPNILETLNTTLYESKIDSVRKNFELSKKYVFPEKIIQEYIDQNV